jgi:hypothetical protein
MQIFGLDLMAGNTHKSELVNWLIVKGTEGEGSPSARVDLRSTLSFVGENHLSDFGGGILWARRKAVEENTSVSRLVGEMLERQMRLSDDYLRAFEHWKSSQPSAAASAAGRMSREELHKRKLRFFG